MREALFKKQNLDKWESFEKDAITKDPDVLSERYIQLTDDLSYSRTFYPESPTTRYLNELTIRFFGKIYVNKKEKTNRFILFWKEELPTLFYNSRKEFLYAFLFFMVSVGIGVISAANDETFARIILGSDYVDMTLENVEKGDPMAVYSSMDSVTMFFMIAFNNIKVDLVTFVLGALFSLGTVYVLFQNGVMVGVFQYFCFKSGFLKVSLLTIWLHGTLEMSACVLAGCAGLVMGNSLLFPKTYSRLESFKQGAKQGLKIVMGIVPITAFAAFIESFITRMHLSTIPSLMIIIPSGMFIVWYFVIYPIQLNSPQIEPSNHSKIGV
jgi:uncharacterized membrane protein SpoIIM required for sporulation